MPDATPILQEKKQHIELAVSKANLPINSSV
jgi:hypothetical protein